MAVDVAYDLRTLIRAELGARRMTMTDLATALGEPKQKVSRWMSDDSDLLCSAASRMLEALDITFRPHDRA